jgi:hypothetical protein
MEGTVENFAKFFVAVIVALIAYRLLVKPVVPATIQGWIGL